MYQTVLTLLSTLTTKELIGLVIFFFGAANVIIVHILRWKSFGEGMQGDNRRWDNPDMWSYICSYVFPVMIIADWSLPDIISIPEYGYWFMITMVFFFMLGPAGLIFVRRTFIAIKGGVQLEGNEFEQVEKKKTVIQEESKTTTQQ